MYIRLVWMLAGAILMSCGDDLELISVERNALVEFSVTGSEASWKSRSIRVIPGPSVVKSVGEPAQAIMFKRYFMIAQGSTPDGQNFELTITFDVANKNDLRHQYTPVYDAQGGLDQVTLITQTSNQYTVREVCTAATGVFFEIDRQSREEKLLSGNFNVQVCVEDSADVITISQATFRDINY